jgi:hypothetical protein
VIDNDFLIYQSALTLGVTAEPSAFGPAIQVAHVGANTIFVYGYDIASRFGPAVG